MDDAGGVGLGKAVRDLLGQTDRAAERARAFAKQLPKRLPSTHSIAKYAVSPSRPTSWIVRMFGWLSAEAARASRSKRSIRSDVATSAGRTLIATGRPSQESSVR